MKLELVYESMFPYNENLNPIPSLVSSGKLLGTNLKAG